MNLKENLENALSGEDVEVKPVISVTQAGIIEAMEQTNASWPEAHTNPEQMAILGSSLHELAALNVQEYLLDLQLKRNLWELK